jgi:N-carbamoyl-L-amino-acid hydrolase
MAKRADALTAAAEFLLDVEAAPGDLTDGSEAAVATVGKLDVSPNAPNVVPGGVDLTVDVRDVEYDTIAAVTDAARESLARLADERPVETSLDHAWDRRPVEMSPRLRRVVRDASEAARVETLDLHSGAGHDTMHVASVTDAALLFAPSVDGISHNPREWTDWADCAAVTDVLARTIADLATA